MKINFEAIFAVLILFLVGIVIGAIIGGGQSYSTVCKQTECNQTAACPIISCKEAICTADMCPKCAEKVCPEVICQSANVTFNVEKDKTEPVAVPSSNLSRTCYNGLNAIQYCNEDEYAYIYNQSGACVCKKL